MGFLIFVIVITVIIFLVIGGKKNQVDVSGDSCIDQIVQFVRTVSGIKKDGLSSWIDFYSSEKTIVCRFYDFDGSLALRLISDYTNNSYPNKGTMIEEFKKTFNKEVNFSSFPQGTRLEIQDANEGTYQLLFAVTPMNQNSMRSYRSAVANAIRQAGIDFADTDRKGYLDPNRIYIL